MVSSIIDVYAQEFVAVNERQDNWKNQGARSLEMNVLMYGMNNSRPSG